MRIAPFLFIVLLLVGCQRDSVIPQPTIFNPNLLEGAQGVEPTTVTGDSVVFVGDSLTHIGWWRSHFPDVNTANQGIGGNMTLSVLDRLQPIIDAQPKKIFLLIGANDYNFGVPPALIFHNIDLIVRRITEGSPNTELYLQTIMPFGKDVRQFFPQIPKTYKTDTQQLNHAILLLGGEHRITVLDTYGVMADKNGDLPPHFTADKIHLEAPGYSQWVEFLRPYVVNQ